MKKLFYLFIALMVPAALFAADDINKQVDKPPKEQPAQIDKQDDGKQGKPVALALDPQQFEFVRTNLVSTFYHELAHALIDVMDLPVLGQEEDAADVFSVVVIEQLFKSQEALAINSGGAMGFKVDADDRMGKGREWDWADEHGPDMQRYYNIVCLTYGSNPENRSEFAKEMGLPVERAEYCNGEYDLAKRGWFPIIKRIEDAKSGEPVSFHQSARTALQQRAAEVIEAEVKLVNERFNLPKRLRVTVKRCGRGRNMYAFYSSSRHKITVCTNYIDQLYRTAPR
ncbi:DUF4344 domain-containing metallopeptidase [Profundibacter sp.]